MTAAMSARFGESSDAPGDKSDRVGRGRDAGRDHRGAQRREQLGQLGGACRAQGAPRWKP
jgi:hypothetical protein